MAFEAELRLLKKLLSQFHLNTHLANTYHPLDENIDLGLRKFLGLEDDYNKSFRSFMQRAMPNTIYIISDSFFCNYVVMVLPEQTAKETTVLAIGPYIKQGFSKQDLYKVIEKFQIPPSLVEQLQQYYNF